MKPAVLLAGTALLISSPATALETYCNSTNVRTHDRGHFEAKWWVVHPSARRTQMPGQTKPTTTCSISYASVGAMYRPIEIIKPPKNGRAEIRNTYVLAYSPTKLGPDEVTIKIYWDKRGQLAEATVRYLIDVVDKPL
jgi:hypothetical protein